MAKRVAENPIITPEMVKPSAPNLEVIGAFNPGATRFGDEIILLCAWRSDRLWTTLTWWACLC